MEKFEDIADLTEDNLTNGIISDEIFKDFMACKQILSSKRKTNLDFWISIIAFIFVYKIFECSLRFIKENDYINILIDRINYKNIDTKKKMEQIRECSNNYLLG